MKETLQTTTLIKDIDLLNSEAWNISRNNPKKSFELSQQALN